MEINNRDTNNLTKDNENNKTSKGSDWQINKIFREKYPYLLNQLAKPPKCLNIIGPIPPPDYKYLCIVGSRSPSEYGREACRVLIDGLSGFPIVIVSGLAIGIDSLAHECALRAGLKTISIPGSGLDKKNIYPNSKIKLAEEILKSGGALISPFENDQLATEWTFPVRNAVMAGMSHAVLVIEGRKKSGTLITAKVALDMNRQVLVVPGSIFSDLSAGPNNLLYDGATSITNAGDILRALDFVSDDFGDLTDQNDREKNIKKTLGRPDLYDMHKKLISLLVAPRTREDLQRKLNVSPRDLATTIVELELKNIVKDGGEYISLY